MTATTQDLQVCFLKRIELLLRMHLNDLENYTPFFILSLLYVATRPSLDEANLLFRVTTHKLLFIYYLRRPFPHFFPPLQAFVGFRLAHTASYLALEHQPGRFICFAGGWAVNAFLAFRVLRSVL